MAIYELNDHRMLCWDDFFIDRQENTEIRQHKPVKRERVFTADQAWEGNVCGYGSLLKVGDKYRLYYRANNYVFLPDGTAKGNKSCFCVAESSDLKAFRRMPINRCTYEGVRHNNIYFDQSRDNFAIIYDENPDCPENERFKALSMGGGQHYSQDGGPHGLYLFVSADGLEFTLKGRLPLPGTFDSYNIMFWDHETKQYYFFYRGEHRTDGAQIEFDVVKKERTIFREIRMSTSPDLVTFEHHGPLDFGKDHIPMQLYTNQVVKYYRARDMFIGFPMRYCDRWEDPESFTQMPLAERHAYMTEHWGREGTAITDCSLITSRDGYHFHKWDEAYLTPGVEERNNWWYGNCCMVYGMEETPSDTEGAPNEISMLMPDNYRIKALEYYRYTTRLDGFVSWYAKLKGGRILTKPFTFTGSELEVNFASSAFGDVVITVCDEAGNAIEGYESNRIFGDSVDRKVKFPKDLTALNGKPVRLSITLRDADLYSFKFNL